MQSPPGKTAKDLFPHMADEADSIIARNPTFVNSLKSVLNYLEVILAIDSTPKTPIERPVNR